MSMIMNVIFD